MQITAYYLAETADGQEFEVGQMVRVDADAVPASDDEDDDSNTHDGEHNYEQIGYVIEVYEDNFSWFDHDEDEPIDVEVNEGETAYAVALGTQTAGAQVFSADELEPEDRDEILGDVDVDADIGDAAEEVDPEDLEGNEAEAGEAELAVGIDSVPRATRTQAGLSPWPESWRKSNKPARLIALDAWTSMGGTFRGCRRSIIGHVRNPNRFCAAWKDQIYMHTYWR